MDNILNQVNMVSANSRVSIGHSSNNLYISGYKATISANSKKSGIKQYDLFKYKAMF